MHAHKIKLREHAHQDTTEMTGTTEMTEIITFYYSSNVLEKVGAVNYCIRCPVGVAGLISPWNLPIYLLTFKIAPAIAAGNTVVCKPSEMTSVTAWMMAKLLNEAGTILHFNSMM